MKDAIFSYNRRWVDVAEWRLRYDKVCLSIMAPIWVLDSSINNISTAIKDLNFGFKITDRCSPPYSFYRRVKRFTSDSHLIEFFYDKAYREIAVSGYIRVTVINKTPVAYLNHAKLLLDLENILEGYGVHVSSLEMALDCSSSEENFRKVTNKVCLKYSRLKDTFHCNGDKSKTGKILKLPGHDASGDSTNYFNERKSSKQAKSYTVTGDTDITENRDSKDIITLKRMRIELSLKRRFLTGKGLNTFSQILAAGPDLFLNQVELIDFNKAKFYSQIRKSKHKGINGSLCDITDKRLDNLLKEPSTEILKELLELLSVQAKSPYQIKKDFGDKIEFPDFVFDAPSLY